MKKGALIVCLAVLGVAAGIPPVATAQNTFKDKYGAVEVDRFDIKEGVQFPADYLLTLQEEILKQLQAAKQFQEVLRPGENPQGSGVLVLRLAGTVNHFKPGSRAKRYVIGLGAGSTEIYAHLNFIDRATGQVVMAQEVRGQMAGGFIGGESLNVTRDFAKKVVNSVKLVREMRLPASGEAATVDAAVRPPSADRHKVTILSSDFEVAEKKLNEEGAAGYHVVDFSTAGSKQAEAILEKTSQEGGAFQYRLLHARLPGNLQKNLNQAAGEGFRLCPHSFGQFGGVMTVIAEKAPASGKGLYEYRVHQTMRVSSAQKNINKDQNEGFVLAETFEQGGVHLVILERSQPGRGE